MNVGRRRNDNRYVREISSLEGRQSDNVFVFLMELYLF